MSEVLGNAFERTLRDVRQGYCLSELSEKLTSLVQQVRATSRGGELILKLKVKPASRGEGVALMIEDEVTVRTPKQVQPQTIFFATEENLLQRNDPRQRELELVTVPAAAVPVEGLRTVGNAVNG
jgi:hypothetical protein